MSKNTIKEMVRDLAYPLSLQTSRAIRDYLYDHHDVFSGERRRMTAQGEVHGGEGVIVSEAVFNLDAIINLLVEDLPLSRHHIAIETDANGEDECENEDACVIQAGVVAWHDDIECAMHNRRLLIVMTKLPLVLQVGVQLPSGLYRATKSASMAASNGCFKAFVIDGSLPHCVVLEEGANMSQVAHKMPVTLLDLPLKNTRRTK